MAPYLTKDQITTRLQNRFEITATIFAGDADIASDELDAQGPFKGEKESEDQARAWPRVLVTDDPAVTPEAVLDWVALRAYQLSTDEDPAVRSESAGRASTTYAEPKISQNAARMARLLIPYQVNTGGFSTVEVASSYS